MELKESQQPSAQNPMPVQDEDGRFLDDTQVIDRADFENDVSSLNEVEPIDGTQSHYFTSTQSYIILIMLGNKLQ